jgi:prolyl-tRNA editing enzyme YbaK/EbsC (Cys-tRNA(Pro) deacylase)
LETVAEPRQALCVLTLYTHKLDMLVLERFVGGRLVLCERAAALTGFGHNAMTPFGSLKPFTRIIVPTAIASASGSYIWLGGGRVDTKLRVFVAQLLRPAAFGLDCTTSVLDCCVAGGEGEE